jgi:poly(A)-specific ribonuclease
LDFEFTGLLSQLDGIHEFDRREDIYLKLRKHTQRYWACQLGLSCFSFSSAEDSYVARPFNFWLFPNNSRKDLTFMPSCIEFLARSGFDFNKLVLQGIPYDKLAAPPHDEDVSSFYMNSASNTAKIDELLRTVEDFIESPQKKFELNVGNPFLRKAFIKQFERRFRGLGYQVVKARQHLLKITKNGKQAS